MDSTDVITPNGIFLPNFPLASGDVLRAIEHSGSVVPTYSNDAGECYAMAMAAVATSNEVQEGAIIVVPLTRTRDDEPLDFTFAAAAKCMYVQLHSTPQLCRTYGQCAAYRDEQHIRLCSNRSWTVGVEQLGWRVQAHSQ